MTNKFIKKIKEDANDNMLWALTQDSNILHENLKSEKTEIFHKIKNIEEINLTHINDFLLTMKELGITEKECYQELKEDAVNEILKNKGIGLHISKHIKEKVIEAITDYSLTEKVTSIYQLDEGLYSKVKIYMDLVNDCLLNHNKDSKVFIESIKYWEDKLSENELDEYIEKLTANNKWLFEKLIDYGKKTNIIKLMENKDIVSYNKEYETILIKENIYNKKEFTKEKLQEYMLSQNVHPLDYIMVNLKDFNNEFKSFVEYDKWAMFVQGQTWQKFKSVLGLIVQNLELKQINDDLINLFKNNINIDIDADESNVNKEKALGNISVILKSEKVLKGLISKKEFIPFLEFVEKNNILSKYLGNNMYRASPKYIRVKNNTVFYEHYLELLNTYQNNTKFFTKEEEVKGGELLLSIHKKFKNHVLENYQNNYNESNDEDKIYWKNAIKSKTEIFEVYESYVYNLCMYACNDKEQFIEKTKLEYIDKLTKCINDNNESLNTSTLLINSNLKQYYESNVITEKEKEKIRNNFLIDTEKYTQEKIERLKNNFGNFSNLGYENQIKGLLETVIFLVKTTQEYEILDSVLNKQLHIRNSGKIEEDKPLVFEILSNFNSKDIEQLISCHKVNSEQIYKKKNILEWYANHNPGAAIKIVEALSNIYQQEPNTKEMVNRFIDKKGIAKIIDKLNSEDEDGELKSKYYYLKLQIDNVLNKKDNEVKKQRKKI